MPAYYIVRVFKVHDSERLAPYREKAPAIVEKYGGRIIAAGIPVATFEGEEETNRTLIIEFPHRQAAENWWNDPDYQALKRDREGAMDAQIFLLDGA